MREQNMVNIMLRLEDGEDFYRAFAAERYLKDSSEVTDEERTIMKCRLIEAVVGDHKITEYE